MNSIDAQTGLPTGSPSALVLDPSQAAVLRLPVAASAVVLGAPGSGKTSTLIELAASRVQAGMNPDHILALTATRASASRLRDRLALRLQRPTRGPLARTPASLAFALVADDATRAGEAPPRLLTGGEQDQIIGDLLAGHEVDERGPRWPDPLDPQVRRLRGFRTELRDLMARAVEYGLDAQGLERLGATRAHPEWVAAAAFMREYDAVVESYRAEFRDSAQLQAEAAGVLARRGEREGAFGALRLVLVDDLHEATTGTLRMLRQLARSGVCVVGFGDPDVASASFRGGRSDAPGRFSQLLGVPAQTLVLSTVHRHGADLRAFTRRITERIGTAAAGAQRSAEARPPQPGRLAVRMPDAIVRIEAPTLQGSLAALARRLREHHLLSGVPWRRMAVVVRSGAAVPAVARALASAEVPTRSSAASRALRDEPAARALVDVATIALGMRELDAALADELLRGPIGGLDALSIRRLRLALRHEELAGGGLRTGEELLAEAVAAQGRLATIDSAAARRAARFASALASARRSVAEAGSIEEVLWAVWERVPPSRDWPEQARRGGILADEANRHLDAVVALFTAAKRFVERSPGRPAGDFVAEFLGTEVPEDTLAPRSVDDSVLVATPSAVVGMEFDVVGIAGVQEGVWPNLRPRGSLLHADALADAIDGVDELTLDVRSAVLSDELRLFALAVSRAREQVILTAVASDDEQPSPFLGLSGVDPVTGGLVHPLSLRGMTGALRRTLAASAHGTDEAAATALAVLADAGVAGASPAEWYGLLEPSTVEPLLDSGDPTATVRVSPSGLEKFERHPLAWFVDRMAAEPSGLAAGIGTVVHAVLEELGDAPIDQVSTDQVWSRVERRWGELTFESALFEKRGRRDVHRMAAGLSAYLVDFARSGGRLVAAERRFEVQIGHALIAGSIDRVELTADGALVVVDLKTGKYAPRGAEMAEHAQLGTYQLAIAHGALNDEPIGPEPTTPAPELRAPSGGAKLVFVARKLADAEYTESAQPGLDADAVVAFETRIRDAAEGMGSAVFSAPAEAEERGPYSRWGYRLQLIPAVSS